MYKCKVVELDLYKDSKEKIMNVELLEKYNPQQYTFSKLKEYGLNSIRSARRIPSKLSQKLNNPGK